MQKELLWGVIRCKLFFVWDGPAMARALKPILWLFPEMSTSINDKQLLNSGARCYEISSCRKTQMTGKESMWYFPPRWCPATTFIKNWMKILMIKMNNCIPFPTCPVLLFLLWEVLPGLHWYDLLSYLILQSVSQTNFLLFLL